MLRKKKGMTLIEVIVAMAIFAIIVASLLPAFIFVARINVVSKDGVDITAIAQQEAEKFYGYSRRSTFANILNLTEITSVYDDSIGTDGELVLSQDAAKYTIVIRLWSNTPSSGMTKFRIIVALKDEFNAQNSMPEQIDTILLFR